MSLARARAILESSASKARDFAFGSILCRSSSTSTAIRVSSALIWLLGSGGRGAAGGDSVAQPASINAARKAKSLCRMVIQSARQNFEQAGRTHAAADAHGDHAKSGAAPPAFDQDVPGQARAGHAIGMADGNGAAIHICLG